MRGQVCAVGNGTKGTSGSTLIAMTIATIIRAARTSPPRFTNKLVAATVTADNRHSATGRSVIVIRAAYHGPLTRGKDLTLAGSRA